MDVEKIMKLSRGPFFFFFFFFACHFMEPLKIATVWGLPKWTIFTRKKHISRWENWEK